MAANRAAVAAAKKTTVGGGGSNGEKVAPGTIEETPEAIKIVIAAKEKLGANDEAVLYYYRPDGNYTDWNVWLWVDAGEGAQGDFTDFIDVDGKKVAYLKFSENSPNNDVKNAAESDNGKINFIIRKGNWADKDPDLDRSWNLSWGKHFAAISGNSNVYAVDPNAKPQIVGAVMISPLEMQLTLSCKYAISASPSNNGFTIRATDGTEVKITNMRNYTYRKSDDERYLKNYNFTSNFWVEIGEDLDLEKTYKISHAKFIPDDGKEIGMNEVLSTKAAEKEAANETLGAIYTSASTTFKVWAPLASEVSVLIYDDWNGAKEDGKEHNFILTEEEAAKTETANKGKRTKMTLNEETGVWSVEIKEDLKGKYYTYEITNGGSTNRICDIYAHSAAPDSVAGQIVDLATDTTAQPAGWEIEYTNPFEGEYTDAVIYEMHIRDWSRAFVPNSTGKFDEITSALKSSDPDKFAAHLKDLGVTHVQILPMFDYAEKNDDGKYNWGYNPYQYNVPEGRYVNKPDVDGRNAVCQMRTMIQAFHEAGIAVNMDVVYNHTNGTGIGSLFDMTVPYYYYRLTNGTYSNGSGCGNETASNRVMFKKYMIDSLKHWMNDYHINGFRFDLMGLHEKETMKEIYAELKKIDKHVMVYGEPWTGGSSPVENGITSDSKKTVDAMEGVAMFNDDIRNAIKGAEFGGFQKGFVQGTYEDGDKKDLVAAVIEGLKGSPSLTKHPGRSINYVECHDNYTLADKLAISLNDGKDKDGWKAYDKFTENQQNELRAQNKLAAALVFLAQGTPFINGGQEFMRTKQGDENSYASDDEINQIDLKFKEYYKDVYNVYKGLIKLRKENREAFGSNTKATAEKANNDGSVIKYTTEDFVVYFNSSNEAFKIPDSDGYKAINVTEGKTEEIDSAPTAVEKKSFVILKKKS
ncbi:MAG: type I pullulanase [Spirochaetales bacterium]|nr:type I pullulanase [Spirochaetales bacterium]